MLLRVKEAVMCFVSAAWRLISPCCLLLQCLLLAAIIRHRVHTVAVRGVSGQRQERRRVVAASWSGWLAACSVSLARSHCPQPALGHTNWMIVPHTHTRMQAHTKTSDTSEWRAVVDECGAEEPRNSSTDTQAKKATKTTKPDGAKPSALQPPLLPAGWIRRATRRGRKSERMN